MKAWQRVSKQARWTYAEAVPAMTDICANSTDWLLPAHVTERIKNLRNDKKMREAAEQAFGHKMIHSGGIPNTIAPDNLGPGVARLHAVACKVMPNCRGCGAKGGARCTLRRSERLAMLPCLPRITAARKAGWDSPVKKEKCLQCSKEVTGDNSRPENYEFDQDGGRPFFRFTCPHCRTSWAVRT